MNESTGSMAHCYRAFIDRFPWKLSEFPTYERWITSDLDEPRIFRQGWDSAFKTISNQTKPTE